MFRDLGIAMIMLCSIFCCLISCFFSKCLRLEVWTRECFLEASIPHVRSLKYYGIPYFFTNNSGIPHYFIMEFHIKNKLWKTDIKYYCPFIMNFHSCSEPRIVLNWGHMLKLCLNEFLPRSQWLDFPLDFFFVCFCFSSVKRSRQDKSSSMTMPRGVHLYLPEFWKLQWAHA